MMWNSGDYLYNTDEAEAIIKERLSQKRLNHSLNVAHECGKLARLYNEDEERACYAGLLHDVCKELPHDELLDMVKKSKLSVKKEELASKALWHSIAGAYYVQNFMGVKDCDIINAIRFHTVGRAGMSRLEEIVYLGDLVSADRDYKDVKKMRRLAYSDIDKAMLEALCFGITSVMGKGGYIPVYTLEAYNQYLYVCNEKNERRI